MKIITVKENRNIEDNQLISYIVNGSNHVPIDPDNYLYQKVLEWINNGNTPEPAFTEEERLNYLKEKLKNDIQFSASKKINELKMLIIGVTDPNQLEVYEVKYEKAKEAMETGDYSYFEPDAWVDGVSPEEEANLVIQNYEASKEAIAKYIPLIEMYRRKAKKIVDGFTTIEEIERGYELLNKANEFGLETTEDDIKALFEEFET